MTKYVAYYRESTKKQVSRRQAEKFGLQSQAGADEEHWGLDSQKLEVQQYIAANDGMLIAEYIEAESGRKSKRPKLKEALNHVKLSGAILIVAKLERLARNVAFLSALMESKVEFICCDMPSATPLTLHIMVSVAEDEAKRDGTRTAAGLRAAKAAGVKLGAARPGYWERRRETGLPDTASIGPRASAAARRENTKKFRDLLKPCVMKMRAEGNNPQQIADALNEKGFATQAQRPWTVASVCVLLRVFEERVPLGPRGKSLPPEVVVELKTRYEGGEQCTALAQWLNSKGFRTTRGNDWDAVRVYKKVNYGKKPTKR